MFLEPSEQDLQENVPLLYFWYAEMEVAASTSCSNSKLPLQRAVHILSCLGGNMKYTPFKSQTSGLQLLRAHQGFKEQIKSLRFAWARDDIKEHSVAYICSASLFEALITGWSAGIEVLEQAFAMALPGPFCLFFNLQKNYLSSSSLKESSYIWFVWVIRICSMLCNSCLHFVKCLHKRKDSIDKFVLLFKNLTCFSYF